MAKRRFTWLDGLICAILALAVAGGAIWYFFFREAGSEVLAKQYDLTLRFTQSTTDPYDFYKVGDTMYYMEGEKTLGTITALKSMDKITEYLQAESGKFIDAVDPDWKTIEMTVRANGTLQGGTFKVNGETLHIGKEFYPQSETTRSAITVWDIKEVAE